VVKPGTCLNGDYFYDRDAQYLFLCVSGRGRKVREMINLNTSDCLNLCPFMVARGMEFFPRYWSNQSQWPGGTLPKPADNVTIPY